MPPRKHSRAKFPSSDRRGKEPLDLVHSDLCGKMNEKSLGGAQYFLSFIDDSTRYVWVYFLKSKDQVFEKFLEWKAMVEKSVGRKLKIFRTDNGGEYTSKELEGYLMTEGSRGSMDFGFSVVKPLHTYRRTNARNWIRNLGNVFS